MRWERDGVSNELSWTKRSAKTMSVLMALSVARRHSSRTLDQAALRRIALSIVIGFVDRMEPFLMGTKSREETKRQDEFD